MTENDRWSDHRLEELESKFDTHLKVEEEERRQQQEMYDALFRQGDRGRNVAPGVIQLMVQLSDDVKVLRIAADRQRTFIGGVLFAMTAVWFFLTDVGPVLADKLRRLF